jgi:hypothetical protein
LDIRATTAVVDPLVACELDFLDSSPIEKFRPRKAERQDGGFAIVEIL